MNEEAVESAIALVPVSLGGKGRVDVGELLRLCADVADECAESILGAGDLISRFGPSATGGPPEGWSGDKRPDDHGDDDDDDDGKRRRRKRRSSRSRSRSDSSSRSRSPRRRSSKSRRDKRSRSRSDSPRSRRRDRRDRDKSPRSRRDDFVLVDYTNPPTLCCILLLIY